MTEDKDQLERYGKRLRKARLAKGLTQLELANKAGVHVNHYALIERGKKNPSVTTLSSIVEVLGLTPNDILKQ
jgi:XRE family transcriptional regulator, regulator of sulfur utilization